MAEVFISYKREDRAKIAPIAKYLAELGVEVWYDTDISAGEDFGEVIRTNLKDAKAVISCWSPAAIESTWVRAEADYARKLGRYLPVFIAPCELMPPFNLIHTDDLTKWAGATNDPDWLRLVDRIAKLIGREGVAAAGRATASGDEPTLHAFARRYPDEPAARKIWEGLEARYREEFGRRLVDAQVAAAARIKAERADLFARLAAITPTFEAWLADERRTAAKRPMPDPMALVERQGNGEEQSLRGESAALLGALAQAEARQVELDAAKAEILRLSQEKVMIL